MSIGNTQPMMALHRLGTRYIGFFLLALFVRVAYLVIARPPFASEYWPLADSLLHNGTLAIEGVKTTEFEPLYPISLAVGRFICGDHVFVLRVLQIAMASIGAIYLYRLTDVLTGRSRIAVISAVIYALDPLLVRAAVVHSEATLMIPLLIAFAYYFVTTTTIIGSIGAGSLLGLVVLTRSVAVPLVPASAALLIADRRSRGALALSSAALIVIAPMLVRNHAVNGSWWPTRSGLNLFIANTPYTAALLPEHDPDLLEPLGRAIVAGERPDLIGASRPEYDRAVDLILTKEAVRYITEHPGRAVRQKLQNIGYFFSPRIVPYRVANENTRVVIGPEGAIRIENDRARPFGERIAYMVFYPTLLAAFLGIYLRRQVLHQDALLWCIAFTFVAVYAMYVPATRYRAPMSFTLLFYSAVALDRGAAFCMSSRLRFNRRRTHCSPRDAAQQADLARGMIMFRHAVEVPHL